MKQRITLLTAVIAGTLSCSALAASPNWQFAEAGYTNLDNDFVDFDGLSISSKYLLDNNIYLNGEYSDLSKDGYDLNRTTLGAGYRIPMNSTTDAYVGANYERVDTNLVDENGYSVNAGVRSMVTREVELMGQVGYYDVDDGDVTVKVGANYYFAPRWAAGLSYEKIDDADFTQVTARYTF